MLRVNAATGGKADSLAGQLTADAGKPIAAESVTSAGLADEANALFDEARGLVAGDKTRAAAIESLIREASKFESRGAIGHPRNLTRRIGRNESHRLEVQFAPDKNGAIVMRSTGA